MSENSDESFTESKGASKKQRKVTSHKEKIK
jgi:hypothetical protein